MSLLWQNGHRLRSPGEVCNHFGARMVAHPCGDTVIEGPHVVDDAGVVEISFGLANKPSNGKAKDWLLIVAPAGKRRGGLVDVCADGCALFGKYSSRR